MSTRLLRPMEFVHNHESDEVQGVSALEITCSGRTLGLRSAVRFDNYGGPTGLVIDVTGYYVKQLAGFISPSGGAYAGSSRIVSSARITDPGVYEITSIATSVTVPRSPAPTTTTTTSRRIASVPRVQIPSRCGCSTMRSSRQRQLLHHGQLLTRNARISSGAAPPD